MANVDDSATIASVFEAMGADPRLTRRAAIIRLAGEGALRRIERKMAAMEEADPHALDTARRETVHAAHARLYPVAGIDAPDLVAFCARYPDAEGRTRTALLGIRGTRILSTFAGEALHVDGAGMASVNADCLKAETRAAAMRHGMDVLTWYGLLHRDGWARSDEPGGLVHLMLSRALCQAWREASLGSHLDDDALLAEAGAAESPRLSQAGLDAVLARFPTDFAVALSGCADYVREMREGPSSFVIVADWVMELPARAHLLVGLGPMATMAMNPGSGSGAPECTTPTEFLFREIRGEHVQSSDINRVATPSDAVWLISEFGPRSGLPMLSPYEVRALARNRPDLERRIGYGKPERAALTRLLRLSGNHLYERPRLDRWLALADAAPPAFKSFAAALTAIEGVAEEQGIPAAHVAECIVNEALDLLASTWTVLVDGITAPMLDARRDHGRWDGVASSDATLAIEEAALDLVSAGDGWKGLAEAVLAWRKAGRPGFAERTPRDHVGRVSMDAFSSFSLRHGLEFDEGLLAGDLRDHLSREQGPIRFGENLAKAKAIHPLPPVVSKEDWCGTDWTPEDVCPSSHGNDDEVVEPESFARWWKRPLGLASKLPWRRAA